MEQQPARPNRCQGPDELADVWSGESLAVHSNLIATVATKETPKMTTQPTHTPPAGTTRRSATIATPGQLLVTVKQACQMLGLGRTSLHHLVVNGELKQVRIGSAVRFSVDHLHEFIDAHATER